MCEIEDTLKKFSDIYHDALRVATEGKRAGLEATVLGESRRLSQILDDSLKTGSDTALVLALYAEVARIVKRDAEV